MNALNLILRPVITEKATLLEKEGKYCFFVRKEANKIEIRQAFQKLYGVTVSKVNMISTPSKSKLGKGRKPTKKKAELKKVIVTTAAKKVVDLMKPKLRT